MKFFGKRATLMPLAAVTATLAFGVPQAGAQGLFEMLFGGGIKHAPQGDFPPPPKHKPKVPAGGGGGGGTRISSPSYYTYKADRLARVDFAPLVAAQPQVTAQDAAFVPSATSTAFREAVAGLSDYELYA
ncbi:MAG: hypothetical protein ABJB10_10420, partial [Mesorhizobium sp.]